MKRSRRFTVGALACASALVVVLAVQSYGASPAPAAAATARTAAANVTIRVEGIHSTLIPQTRLTTTPTSIDPDKNPADTCTGDTAASALQEATKGNWTAGEYFQGLGYPVVSIDGEAYPFTSAYYWSLWINDKPTTTGICQATLHASDSVLFFPECSKASQCPQGLFDPSVLDLRGPASARLGKPFTVTVKSLANLTGKASAGVRVKLAVAGRTITTGSSGTAKLRLDRAGTYRIVANAPQAIRDELTVTVGTRNARLSSSPVGALASSSSARYIALSTSFLRGAQNTDGGFGAAGGHASDELYTAWAAIGLGAAGRSPLSVTRDGHSVLDGLRAQATTLSSVSDMERTILALHACGVSPYSLGGLNPVAQMLRSREADGSFEQLVNITAFAIFALRAAGHSAGDPAVRAAGQWIERQQDSDGGFGFAVRGGGSDVDDTAAALQALVAAGTRSGPVVSRAVSFLIAAQGTNGGFPQQPGGEANGQSTAWAVQGLLAAGRNPEVVRRPHGRSPLEYLQGLTSVNGSVRYAAGNYQTPVWVTAEVLAALARKPFPVAPVGG